MLKITDLHAEVGGTPILKGLSLEIPSGEVHAIMGPNGAGKSTLGYVLTGREGYEVTGGSAVLDGVDLLALAVEERAAAGVFLAFQYPVSIPGVSNLYFMRAALNGDSPPRLLPYVRNRVARILPAYWLSIAVNVSVSLSSEVIELATAPPPLALYANMSMSPSASENVRSTVTVEPTPTVIRFQSTSESVVIVMVAPDGTEVGVSRASFGSYASGRHGTGPS